MRGRFCETRLSVGVCKSFNEQEEGFNILKFRKQVFLGRDTLALRLPSSWFLGDLCLSDRHPDGTTNLTNLCFNHVN